MILNAQQLGENVLTHGRTLLADGALWFNWSCSGFTLRFRGSSLKAVFRVIPDRAFAVFGPQEAFDHPCIAVLADGGSEPLFRRKLEAGGEYTLFEGGEGEHTVRVVRLSENNKGKAGIVSLSADGELLPPPEAPGGPHIEVAGDSITCGYGNETSQPGFDTQYENALKTYGWLAAKELGAEYSCVAVSGCSVAAPTWLPGIDDFHAMETLYEYTDKPLESALGAASLTPWDFKAHPVDAVVMNLGTNDANEVKMNGFSRESVDSFHRHYGAMVEQLRRLNGSEAWIVCTLGPMDYYLWDDIRDVVEEYKARTGDGRVICRKLGGIVSFTEGSGADTHPSAATHERMGRELAAMLRECFEKGGTKK
ncbi:MAG: hypothetical protein J5827_02765 [Oscillospiraceae bacterium]|nr:hypothetical protein [Oscillospiraceae bacterium]